jgi:hypothetical protein
VAAGCQGPNRPPVNTAWTLRDNPRLPTDSINRFYSYDKFAALRDRRYEGYVILEAEAITETKIRIDRVAEAFPDDSRVEIAKELAGKARSSARNVGSHLPPPIEVYVIFYRTSEQRIGALVYGEELPAAGAPSSNRASLFLYVVGDTATELAPNDLSTVKLQTPP